MSARSAMVALHRASLLARRHRHACRSRRAGRGTARAVGGRRAVEGDRRLPGAGPSMRQRSDVRALDRRHVEASRVAHSRRARRGTTSSSPCTTKRRARASIRSSCWASSSHESDFKQVRVLDGRRARLHAGDAVLGAADRQQRPEPVLLRTNLRYGCTILRHYLDVERGDLFRALGRYNGSLGRAEYPSAVLAAMNRYAPATAAAPELPLKLTQSAAK